MANKSEFLKVKNLTIFGLFFFITLGLAYFTFSRNNLTTYGSYTDVQYFEQIYNGKSLDSIPKQFRYRILTPLIAGYIPVPESFIQKYFSLGYSDSIIHFKFLLLNTLFLSFTAVFFYFVLLNWNFNNLESLLGSLFFLTSYNTVNWALMANADASSYFILVIGILAVQQQKIILYGFVFAVGLFFKETAILLPLFYIVTRFSKKNVRNCMLATLPGIILFMIFRLSFASDFGALYSADRFIEGLHNLFTSFEQFTYTCISVMWSFGGVWILFAVGLRDVIRDKIMPYYRLLIFVIFIMFVPVIINAQMIGRIWFLSFPVIIPISLLGLRRLLSSQKNYENTTSGIS